MDKELSVSLMLLGFGEAEDVIGQIVVHSVHPNRLALKLGRCALTTHVVNDVYVLELRYPYFIKERAEYLCPKTLLKVITTILTDFNEKGSLGDTTALFEKTLLKIVTDKHNNVQESP